MLEFDIKDKSIPKWLIKNKSNSNIIVSSRARIARNIKGFPYLFKLETEDKKEILDIISTNIRKINPLSKSLIDIKLNSQTKKFKKYLKERFLITDYLLKGHTNEIIFNKNENINIMINEEDHLRIQAIYPGLSIKKAYLTILNIEKEFEKYIDFDFDLEFGYLTSCPTNVGTGLRVSVMLHLPALAYTSKVKTIIDNLIESGYAVRGFYGEGTKYSGDLYQISNQTTLGVSEEDIIKKVEQAVIEIEKLEKKDRGKLIRNKKVYNKIIKSFLILKNSLHISLEEAMNHISLLKLGEWLNYIKIPESINLNKLLIMIQPMHLIYLNNLNIDKVDSNKDNKLRSNFIKKFIQRGNICLKNLQQEPNRL